MEVAAAAAAYPSLTPLRLRSIISTTGSLSRLDSGKLKLRLKYSPLKKFQQPYALATGKDYPQNADLPRQYSKREKKPFPIPIVELRRAARERAKNRSGQPRRPAPPPKRGLLVKNLIPVAYDVLNARIILINNLKKLLKVVPVHACVYCNEIHVGPTGHPFKSCKGPDSSFRRALHEWTNAAVEDVLLQVESYHLFDRLGKRIRHDERFSIPRIPAVTELCIQAGVEIPEFPAKRRRKPIIRLSRKEFIDADESDLPDPDPIVPLKPILTEMHDSEVVAPSNREETTLLAEETLQMWEKMRGGARRLMMMYPVRVCGYCPEVHVGPSGHKAQNCGAFKHQQRNGQHGWQAAVLNDLIPPRYVWHVPDVNGPPLKWELKSFYGQAPAIVEICVQAGAAVPEQYKPTMRYCNEIHVGPTGHPFKSCKGSNSSFRRALHEWTNAAVEDVLLQVESYHLFDRLGKRIRHDERFSIPRIPAVTELCIQAGVEIPEFPAKRRRKPIIRLSRKEFIDADESDLPDPDPLVQLKPILTEIHDSEVVAPSNREETTLLAEETLQMWEKMRGGARRLMMMYPVRVCGYCPEVHVGPSGHKAQNCGAFKHQQRNGQHGWQAAVLNDLIPPRYVWHVPDVNGPPMKWELKSFYGQAPAIVEICVQAGAAVPEQYKPTMRLDVGIPTSVHEAEMVV